MKICVSKKKKSKQWVFFSCRDTRFCVLKDGKNILQRASTQEKYPIFSLKKEKVKYGIVKRSNEERMGDAQALRGDEGRDKLR